MRLALTTPVLGSAALALAVTAGALYARSDEPRGHRLVLHTYAEPDATYISAWAHGDVRVTLDGSTLQPIQFKTRAWYVDGCRWMGIETLEPLDDRTFSYSYDETLLGCSPEGSAERTRKTPRTGIVVVVKD